MARAHARASGSHAETSVARRAAVVSHAPAASPAGAAASGQDPLSDVLRTVKLTGALYFLVDATSPWGVEVPAADLFAPIILPRAQHVVSYHIVLEGSGYAGIPGMRPMRFVAGDIIIFPHADPYAMLSQPDQTPELTPDGSLEFFRQMAAGKIPFVVHEGGGGPEHAKFVCGFLGCDLRPFNPLLKTLPRLLHVKRPGIGRSDLLDGLIDLTLAEAQVQRIGGESIRLGLSELVFIEAVRRYLSTLEDDQRGWLAGLRDPLVGRALTLLHAQPGAGWSLERLARQAGASRSVLAERFRHLTGYPPMQYLTRWRMQLAARLLSDGTSKVSAVGLEVGYESEAAFSRTFKRIAGASPATWRERSAASHS